MNPEREYIAAFSHIMGRYGRKEIDLRTMERLRAEARADRDAALAAEDRDDAIIGEHIDLGEWVA